MPRRKFIDKKTATTFQLVHRAQNDPRIHDSDAPDMVFKETITPNLRPNSSQLPSISAASEYSSISRQSKIKSRGDLEDEFGVKVRRNEGEAANYGVFYDDTEYDYMQHMRDLGGGGGEGYFIEAPQKKGKEKEKVDLADALRDALLDDRKSEAEVSESSSVSKDARDMFGEDMAPSKFVMKTSYQDQQDIPDALRGFQPDMDPRLREVLEALEDEAYVDDEEDMFAELAADGAEVDPAVWEAGGWDAYEGEGEYGACQGEEDQGWETDDTIKASSPNANRSKKIEPPRTGPATLPAPEAAPLATEEGDNAWLDEFNKFKKDSKASRTSAAKATPSDIQSSILTGTSALTTGRRHKKRKGALTSTSGYSMTSSALHRTEGLTLLDERFDKIEEEYAIEEFPDDVSNISGLSKMSRMSKTSDFSRLSGTSEAPALRADFDNIMDDFLSGHSMSGKRRVKKGGYQSGLEQLDEVRKGLGPARIKTQKV
ncbi:low-temperature viability protein-like protein ltv1 [Lepidopterella palustris CBS 459.81]|uniref:Low-temperature viability protein-like protein ltv1 n=1 Tax=Lepidopterella palustris CBS 459.81 TaxID=1314670 RepID=A0A8E2JHI4_9PEZI|nr:low-temperature viability protein-like protein ltv1 [Lepidopterella palustris CBS 459.81]